MNFIDSLLNRITMYRLVLYYLIALLVSAGVLGYFSILPNSPLSIAYSTAVVVVASGVANYIFAKIWKAVPGDTSFYITALILASIVTPVSPENIQGAVVLAIIGVLAMASKYVIAIKGKHIFNPAAVAVVLSALVLNHGASWWIAGNIPLMALVIVGGFLIARKIQRLDLVFSFFAASLITIAVLSVTDPLSNVRATLVHSPFFFLAFTMLTDPATMPGRREMRIAYGILVGIWFAPQLHIGSFHPLPEMALIFGNLFAYIVTSKDRLMLTLKEKKEIALNTYEFIFSPNKPLRFEPGQYLEWTLPHKKGIDSKGNRRYFTIASAPTEGDIHMAVKIGDPASSYKKELLELPLGEVISAGQLAGDFTLPKNTKKKLVFIAGGIGVTPFRSMVRYLFDGPPRDVVMLYSNKTAEEVAYYDLFERAGSELGIKTIYALTADTREFSGSHKGMIDRNVITSQVPDYKERLFYISGPRAMVLSFEKTLSELGISKRHIKTDYFPGFV